MTQIRYQKDFIRAFKLLPKNIRQKAVELEVLFRENPFHFKLHTKKLQGKLKLFYSFRINRDYRVIFEFLSDDEAGFISVKHRKDIYRK